MYSNHSVNLPTRSWAGDVEEKFTFPQGFEIDVRYMAGHDFRKMNLSDIQKAIRIPVEGPPLRELAQGCSRACIVFDDITRPTPVDLVAPVVINELVAAGVEKNAISFVAATAAHAPMNRRELAAKLGQGILASYPVYNHNMYENVCRMGCTSLGLDLEVNKEVAQADLVVGIGGILPYWWNGVYSGGGKIILPGVAGKQSIIEHHRLLSKARRGEGGLTMEKIWNHMAEAADIVGMRFLVGILPSIHRQIIGIFSGDPSAVHHHGSSLARVAYCTNPAPPSDIVVINTYPQETQIAKTFWGIHASIKPGGTAVIVSRHPEGLSHVHYLTSRFGNNFGGANWNENFRLCLSQTANILFYVNRMVQVDVLDLKPAEGVVVKFYDNWEKIIQFLEKQHGPNPSVAIYPYAALQENPLKS